MSRRRDFVQSRMPEVPSPEWRPIDVIAYFVRPRSCAVATLVTACGGGESTAPSGSAASAAEPPPPLPGESTITGRVTLNGTAPEARLIKVSASDPLCMVEGGTIKSELIVVGPDNALQNVFLYVKDGLGDRTFTAPKTPVVLDQVGCQVPAARLRRPGGPAGGDRQQRRHAAQRPRRPKTNGEFNFMQTVKGRRDMRTFDKPEVMVPFRCDVHGWMNSYGGVVRAPVLRREQRRTGRSRSRGCPPAPSRSRRGTSSSARRPRW